MFLSWEIDIKRCQIYTKIHINIQFCIKVVVLNRSYSTNTQPIWKRRDPTGAQESQVCSYYNLFAIFIDIIENIITYSPNYVTRTSANGSAVYWSRDFRLYYVTIILKCHWLKFWWRYTDYSDYINYIINYLLKMQN